MQLRVWESRRVADLRSMLQAAGEWTSDVTFFLNGKKVVLPSATVHPRMTLAEYLREHTRLTGTKLSCSQGGCGACNVMLTTFKAGAPQYSSVNACLRPIVSLDGCGVTTTEGLGSTEAGLHPVQERIATCNGSQCGYCTPGHVMAMCVATHCLLLGSVQCLFFDPFVGVPTRSE